MSKYNQTQFASMSGVNQSSISNYTKELKAQGYVFEESRRGKISYTVKDIAVFRDINTMMKENKQINLSLADAVMNVLRDRQTAEYWERYEAPRNIISSENEVAVTLEAPLDMVNANFYDVIEIVRDMDFRMRTTEQNQIEILESNSELKYNLEQVKKIQEDVLDSQKKIVDTLMKRADDAVFFAQQVKKEYQDKLERKERELEEAQKPKKKWWQKEKA